MERTRREVVTHDAHMRIRALTRGTSPLDENMFLLFPGMEGTMPVAARYLSPGAVARLLGVRDNKVPADVRSPL